MSLRKYRSRIEKLEEEAQGKEGSLDAIIKEERRRISKLSEEEQVEELKELLESVRDKTHPAFKVKGREAQEPVHPQSTLSKGEHRRSMSLLSEILGGDAE